MLLGVPANNKTGFFSSLEAKLMKYVGTSLQLRMSCSIPDFSASSVLQMKGFMALKNYFKRSSRNGRDELNFLPLHVHPREKKKKLLIDLHI